MDYEKKYKEALERAKDYHKQLLDEDNPEWAGEIETIFPELKESEDEKMRNRIIAIIRLYCSTPFEEEEGEKMIAWLKKQKPVDFSDEEKGGVRYTDKLFLELTKSESEKIKNGIINLVKNCYEEGGYALPTYDYNKYIGWLENQSESSSLVEERYEPKFKVGDFVVWLNTVYKIVDTKDHYVLNSISKSSVEVVHLDFDDENRLRLWDITEDAKDGDVLVDLFSKDTIIILYKGQNENHSILAYCGWNNYNFSVKTDGLGYGNVDNTKYVLATKEQRDTLERAMTNAGYRWNKEELKLEKI